VEVDKLPDKDTLNQEETLRTGTTTTTIILCLMTCRMVIASQLILLVSSTPDTNTVKLTKGKLKRITRPKSCGGLGFYGQRNC